MKGTTAKYIVGSRDEAIEKNKEWVLTQPWLLLEIRAMKGKTLACWCKPLRCHGDTFVEIAEMNDEEFAVILEQSKMFQSNNQVKSNNGKMDQGRIPFVDQ